MVEAIIDRCRVRGWTIGVAESCTGGLLGGAITAVPGSSDVFVGGVIAYANSVKINQLGVLGRLLKDEGAVSEDVAVAMAVGVRECLSSTVGMAITGVAGPGPGVGKPEGRVCFGVSWRAREPWVRTMEFGALGRSVVRERSVDYAIGFLEETLVMITR